LAKLRLHGDDGATADEIADELNRSILSIRPRFSELLRQGLIRDTGVRRGNQSGCSAKVWRVAFL
jgi:predicted transcriptional regulator